MKYYRISHNAKDGSLDPKSLRIGNLVFNNNEIIAVERLDRLGVNGVESENGYFINADGISEKRISAHDKTVYEYVTGIPISEELLLQFGFKKHSANIYLINIVSSGLKKLAVCMEPEGCSISMVDSYSGTETTEIFPERIHYLHQLDNIYFGITNSELILLQ